MITKAVVDAEPDSSFTTGGSRHGPREVQAKTKRRLHRPQESCERQGAFDAKDLIHSPFTALFAGRWPLCRLDLLRFEGCGFMALNAHRVFTGPADADHYLAA